MTPQTHNAEENESTTANDFSFRNNNSILITILFPCLNEEITIGDCIDQAHEACKQFLSKENARTAESCSTAAYRTYEILVADNGSTDNSVSIAKSKFARVAQIPRKGYGAAIQGGIREARGIYTLMADCDGSYNLQDIDKFILPLQSGYDLVIGNRFQGGIEPNAMPWHHRYIGNPILSAIGRLIHKVPCRDWHCGIRAFNTNAIRSVSFRSTGMEFASEMLVKAHKLGLAITEIPTTLQPDKRERKPHLRSFRDGFRHLALLLRHTTIKQRTFAFFCVIVFASFLAISYTQASSLFSKANAYSNDWIEASEVRIKDLVEGEASDKQITVFLSGNSQSTLRLQKIELGCTCLSATLESNKLPPEGANLEIAFKAAGKPGPFVQKLTLYFQDKAGRSWVRHVLLRGNIVSTIQHVPESVDFGQIKAGAKNSSFTRTIRTTSVSGEKITLTTNSPRLRITPTELPINSSQSKDKPATAEDTETNSNPSKDFYHILELNVDPNSQPGHYRDEVMVALSSEKLASSTLPVIYTIKPIIKSSPSRIFLNSLSPGEPVTVTIKVDLLTDTPVDFPTIRTQLENGSIKHRARKTDAGFEIDITIEYHGTDEYVSDRISLDFGEVTHEIPLVAKLRTEDNR